MGRRPAARRRVATRWVAAVVAVLGASLSLTAALAQQSRQRADARAAFAAQTSQVTDAIADQLTQYAVAGEAIAGFLEANQGEVSRDAYAAFVENLRGAGSLLSAYGFNASRLVTPGGDVARIEYVHPFAANRAALGVDLLTNPLAASAAQAAARADRPRLSDALRLIVEREDQIGVAVLTPYSDERGRTVGWTHVVLRGQDFLTRMAFASSGVALRLSDATPEGRRVIGAVPDQAAADDALRGSGLRTTIDETILGQRWRFEYAALPPLDAPPWSAAPLLILVGGLTVTALAVVLIESLRRSEHRARALAAVRTVELREANERLAANVDELERAAQLKDELLSTVSHEFRTPLAVIRGTSSSELRFRRDVLDDETGEALERIDRNAERLDKLVDDLLTSARLRSGSLEVTPEVVPLRATVASVAADLGLREDDGDLRIEVPVGIAVRVDPDHLSRVLTNLVSNALKYGAPPVVVRATNRGATVDVIVRDHGPGVPEGLRGRLFERFAADGRGRGARSIGLGLSIVRQLARLNGGDVRHEETGGAGARFVVTLPAAPPPSAARGRGRVGRGVRRV